VAGVIGLSKYMLTQKNSGGVGHGKQCGYGFFFDAEFQIQPSLAYLFSRIPLVYFSSLLTFSNSLFTLYPWQHIFLL
jgi:hypothetical protein